MFKKNAKSKDKWRVDESVVLFVNFLRQPICLALSSSQTQPVYEGKKGTLTIFLTLFWCH